MKQLIFSRPSASRRGDGAVGAYYSLQ